jgi:hypothetical protein
VGDGDVSAHATSLRLRVFSEALDRRRLDSSKDAARGGKPKKA